MRKQLAGVILAAILSLSGSSAQAGQIQLATDPFTGTGGTLGANWSDNSANVFERASGVATATSTASDSAARYSAITWPNDQKSEVTHVKVLTTGGLGAGYGSCVRMSTSGSTVTYYRFVGSTAGWELLKQVNNTPTSLSSNASPAFANGDVSSLEVHGSTLVGKRNGVVVIEKNDTSITSGAAGVCYGSTGGDTTFGLSPWTGYGFTGSKAFSFTP